MSVTSSQFAPEKTFDAVNFSVKSASHWHHCGQYLQPKAGDMVAEKKSAAPPARRRNRKRKRRVASSSESSSDSDTSGADSSDDNSLPTVKRPVLPAQAESSSSSSSGSSSEGSDSDSDSDNNVAQPIQKSTAASTQPNITQTSHVSRHQSPTPPPAEIPSFIPLNSAGGADADKEKVLKEKFRKFWMASIADAFSDDLEQIRKEPNLTASRLNLLIDSLASGADVFTSTAEDGGVNEMELVLEPDS